nr:MAG: putative capsid protein [Drosophila Craighall totivirus]
MPDTAISHLWQANYRLKNHGLDMTSVLSGYEKDGKLREAYTIGRRWVPYQRGTIEFSLSPSNYDAATVITDPAWSFLHNFTILSTKDLQSLQIALKFADAPDKDTGTMVVNAIRAFDSTKFHGARFYWRLWAYFFEALAAEESGEPGLYIENVALAHAPIPLNSALELRDMHLRMRSGHDYFFLSQRMVDDAPGVPWHQLLALALADGVTMEHRFTASTCMPVLGDRNDVQLVYQGGVRYDSGLSRFYLTARNIHDALGYFAARLDQAQFINEIGTTVATLLYRPVHDHLWMGSDSLNVELPPARLAHSFFFCYFPVEMQEYPTHNAWRSISYYKAVWTGAVKYLQLALAGSTVLQESQIQTRAHIASLGIEQDDGWFYDSFLRLGKPTRWGTIFTHRAQHHSIALGWGQVFNRMSASFRIPRSQAPAVLKNLSTIPQWSEWFMFGREILEQTPLCSLLAPLVPTARVRRFFPFEADQVSGRTGTRDVPYRAAIRNQAAVWGCVYTPFGHSDNLELHHVPYAGVLPMDGLFCNVALKQTALLRVRCVAETDADVHAINDGWAARKLWYWELDTSAQIKRDDVYKTNSFLDASRTTKYNSFVKPSSRIGGDPSDPDAGWAPMSGGADIRTVTFEATVQPARVTTAVETRADPVAAGAAKNIQIVAAASPYAGMRRILALQRAELTTMAEKCSAAPLLDIAHRVHALEQLDDASLQGTSGQQAMVPLIRDLGQAGPLRFLITLPRQERSRAAGMITAILDNFVTLLPSGGQWVRDYTHARNSWAAIGQYLMNATFLTAEEAAEDGINEFDAAAFGEILAAEGVPRLAMETLVKRNRAEIMALIEKQISVALADIHQPAHSEEYLPFSRRARDVASVAEGMNDAVSERLDAIAEEEPQDFPVAETVSQSPCPPSPMLPQSQLPPSQSGHGSITQQDTLVSAVSSVIPVVEAEEWEVMPRSRASSKNLEAPVVITKASSFSGLEVEELTKMSEDLVEHATLSPLPSGLIRPVTTQGRHRGGAKNVRRPACRNPRYHESHCRCNVESSSSSPDVDTIGFSGK